MPVKQLQQAGVDGAMAGSPEDWTAGTLGEDPVAERAGSDAKY
eukprot:CAMPEP_0170431124 /NCGR_PEP_ID=MMETSP0117_2-20130122/41232_1 /TAXON_ID=400756 /ORGANISM="Durinskia baltica, Strain CSIRO CS-38" /LENGTH=42 /DNA_ID= /DNA_START= /DNA_END= /DNA_ORIENTATION=